MFELTGKTAIITGASRGIGKAIAMKFAQQGANIAFLQIFDNENAAQTEKELSELGVKVKGYECDVSDFNAAKTVIEEIIGNSVKFIFLSIMQALSEMVLCFP